MVVFTSLPFVASVSSGIEKVASPSSSHLFLSLPTALHVLILVLNPGFHSAAFLTIVVLVAMLFWVKDGLGGVKGKVSR